MNDLVIHSHLLHQKYDCDLLPIEMHDSIGGLGRLRMGKLWHSLLLWGRLVAKLGRHRYNATYITVTVHGYALFRDIVTVELCKLLGVRPIFHLHMKGVAVRYSHSCWYRLLYRFLFRGADVIHVSERLYRDVDMVVPPEHFHVVPNGIPDPLPQGTACRPASGRQPPPIILFLSNLLKDKGALDLLQASGDLRKAGIDHQLVFAGAAREQHVIEAVSAAARTCCAVTYAGQVLGDEKWRLLSKADVFVCPSHDECLPLVVIEAMAMGLPVIATKEGAIPDLIVDGVHGLLFPPRDVPSLAAALHRLVTDQALRSEMGAAARRRYIELFGEQRFESRIVATLETILAS